MTTTIDDNLPPHLRDTERDRITVAVELPLELPADADELPPPPPAGDDRPADPYLRRS